MKKLGLLLVVLFAALPASGQILLKQSTATTQNCHLTKIADGTDGTGITVTNITLKILYQSATLSATVDAAPTCAASGTANDCAEKTSGGGYYNFELSATNTGTLGTLDVECLSTGYYSDPIRFQVVSSGYWDLVNTGPSTAPTNFALLSVDANGRIDVIKVAGTTQTAGDIIADTNDIQTRIPAALGANGNIKADVRDFSGTAGTFASGIPETKVASMAANALTAAATAADFTTEIQTGLIYLPRATATSNGRIQFWAYASGVLTTGSSGVTCQISKDGGAFASLTATPTKVTGTGASYYKFDITQGEATANIAKFICSGTLLDTTALTVEFQH